MDSIIVAGVVAVAIVGFGEYIGYITKAAVPSIAVSLITYLILTWVGMPKDFLSITGIDKVGWFVLLLYMVHLATTTKLSEYVKNWRSVVIALAAVICGSITTIGIGGLIFGFGKILTGAGAALGGGAISGIAAIQVLTENDKAALLVIPILMISAVDPLGQPICSAILRRYVKKLVSSDAYLNKVAATAEVAPRLTKDGVPYGSEDNPSPFIRNFIPKKVESEPILILEVAVIVFIAGWVESLTGINSLLLAFLFGILACMLGFLRMNVLDRAMASGLVVTIFIAYLFAGENEITPQLVLEGLGPMVAIVALSAVGLALGAGIAGKLFKYDFTLSAACGVAIMFLFPGASIIPAMMTKRLGRNEEEVKYLYNKIMPTVYVVVYSGLVFGLLLTMLVYLPIAMSLL